MIQEKKILWRKVFIKVLKDLSWWKSNEFEEINVTIYMKLMKYETFEEKQTLKKDW